MKKLISILSVLVLVACFSLETKAQNIESLLESAMSLQGSGNSDKLVQALTMASSSLTTEANQSEGKFKDKLLSSVGGLQSLIPLATSGKLSKLDLAKSLNTVKLLVGANRLSSMLGGGSLLGKSAGVASNLGLLSSGLDVLGGGSASKIGGLISKVSKKSAKLDKGGLFKNLRNKIVGNKLGGILNLVDGAI